MALFEFHIHQTVDVDRLLKEIKIINLKLTKMALTIADVSAKLDTLQATVDAEQEQILAKVGELETTVAELRDQIANGGDQTALQALVDKIDAIGVDIKSTIEDAPEPEA